MTPYRAPAPVPPPPRPAPDAADLAVRWFAGLQLVAALVGLAWLAGVRPRVTAAPAALVALLVARSGAQRGC